VTRDVAPGEAIFIDLDGVVHARQCAEAPTLHPCMFEYVYLARPDSIMDGISVYQARLNMGETLAQRLISTIPPNEIDVVIPIPESSRPSAMQLAKVIGKPYREGFVKNRYVGRTFIMPGQGVRKKSVRQKLNAIGVEFKGRNVLLVDDSIVRGNTSKEIVQMARDAGARRVYMASAAPPVRYPNVYGIDMPTSEELIAHNRSIEEIRVFIGADALIYQDVDAMKRVVGATRSSTVSKPRASMAATSPAMSAQRTSARWPSSARKRKATTKRAPTARGSHCRAAKWHDDNDRRRRKSPHRARAASRRLAARDLGRAHGARAKPARRELRSPVSDERLRAAGRRDHGAALCGVRGFHVLAHQQPHRAQPRTSTRRHGRHGGRRCDEQRHERHPAARHGIAEGR